MARALTHKTVKAQPAHAAATFSVPIGFHKQLEGGRMLPVCGSVRARTHTSLHFFNYLTDFHEIWHEYYMIRSYLNRLTPNDHYSGRTAPLTSKRCILYIYSTNTGTEYFKHGIYSPFLYLQNTVRFIILTYLVPVFFTFYIQSVLKFKKIIPAPKV